MVDQELSQASLGSLTICRSSAWDQSRHFEGFRKICRLPLGGLFLWGRMGLRLCDTDLTEKLTWESTCFQLYIPSTGP
jgi:hypothetical protein